MNTIIPSVNPEKSLPQINIFDNADGNQCVSARELHERLESNERFSKWWDRFSSYGFVENIDFIRGCTKRYAPKNQYTSELQEVELDDYSITIEMAKQICMLQRSEKGREYREYFLKLEKAWNTPEAIMSRALQIANRTLDDAKNQIAVMQPKAEWYDNVADSTNLTEIGTVGKMVGVGARNIFSILVGDKIIMKKCDDGIDYYVPFYDYEKYFKIVPEPFMKGDKKVVRNKLMFNQQGVIWATKKYKAAETPSRWNFEGASLELGLPEEDIRDFLRIKQYIFKVGEKWLATGMGVDFGYVENSDGEVWITAKGLEKVRKALDIPELSPEERARVDAICAEAEKKARDNGVGRDE